MAIALADQRAEQADQRAQEAHISANYLGYNELDGSEEQPIDLTEQEPDTVDRIALPTTSVPAQRGSSASA